VASGSGKRHDSEKEIVNSDVGLGVEVEQSSTPFPIHAASDSCKELTFLCCECNTSKTLDKEVVKGDDSFIVPYGSKSHYLFVCADCNGGKPEFSHVKGSTKYWLATAMWNLELRSENGQRFFDARSEICDYARKHEKELFADALGVDVKQWQNRAQGCLSVNSSKNEDDDASDSNLFVNPRNGMWGLNHQYSRTSKLKRRKFTSERNSNNNDAIQISDNEKGSAENLEEPKEETFVVEGIMGKRITADGQKLEYLIKWEGYKEKTWVPHEQCDCPAKIAEFEEFMKQTRTNRKKKKEKSPRAPVIKAVKSPLPKIPITTTASPKTDVPVRTPPSSANPRNSRGLCHICGERPEKGREVKCTKPSCLAAVFCGACVDVNISDNQNEKWECIVCNGKCDCSACMQNKGSEKKLSLKRGKRDLKGLYEKEDSYTPQKPNSIGTRTEVLAQLQLSPGVCLADVKKAIEEGRIQFEEDDSHKQISLFISSDD